MILIRLLILYPSYTVGAAIIGVLCLRFFLVPSDRRRTEILLATSFMTLILSTVALSLATRESLLRPFKYDLYIYNLGSRFGYPSFVLGRFVLPHLWLELLLLFAYDLLPIAVIVVFSWYLYRAPGELPKVLIAFAISLLLAPVFYYLLPVCGPLYAFPQFPSLPLTSVVPHPIRLPYAPNGIPSVHCSTALLIVWFSRRWKLGAIFSWAYLVLIVFSTLASGQHYFVDLIAAIPYIFLVLWLTNKYEQSAQSRRSFREDESALRNQPTLDAASY